MRNAPNAILLAVLLTMAAGTAVAVAGGTGGASITVPNLGLERWRASTDNLVPARGVIRMHGAAVSGVRVSVDGYALPTATSSSGGFTYLVDSTRLARHVVRVLDASKGQTGPSPLSSGAQAALRAARGSISVAYPITQLRTSRDSAGDEVIEGRLSDASGNPPPTVVLYSYELTGKVVDAQGRPVVGARVSTRTVDRDYWTVSSPTTSDGSFQSLFTASSEAGGNPVPMTIRVAIGDRLYEYLPTEYAYFQRLKSARVEIRLPPHGHPIALPVPRSYPGSIYQGAVVGASVGGVAVRPVRVTWPGKDGRFRLVLPRSLAGRTVSLWEGDMRLFSSVAARAGGSVDLRDWPTRLTADTPQGLAIVRLR